MCRFVNLIDDQRFPIPSHLLDGTSVVCGASSNGYLLTLTPSTADIHLFNPFTHHSLHLPSLLTFPSVFSSSFDNPSFIKKAVSFNSMTVVICGDKNSLAFAELDGPEWIHFESNKSYEDMIYDGLLLWAVTTDGEVQAWDVVLPSEQPRMLMRVGTALKPWRWNAKRKKTQGFEVFKPVQDGWVKLSGVGDDRVLFLGDNESVSLRVEDVPGCQKGNRIYFTDDDKSFFTNKTAFGFHDTGMYDFDEDTVNHEFCIEDAACPSSVWVFDVKDVSKTDIPTTVENTRNEQKAIIMVASGEEVERSKVQRAKHQEADKACSRAQTLDVRIEEKREEIKFTHFLRRVFNDGTIFSNAVRGEISQKNLASQEKMVHPGSKASVGQGLSTDRQGESSPFQ
ncbi:hypothetical protein QJS10_CPA09g00942 [Acorus calamus]|uniref:KIB1-4 beta-propeller domain-containing protein n=1 Tax=Acorus calamus TaxID=4465 RepID=A0AAV9E7L8_ACOCL|nr:hypothetical protein QJS10_CPA09g00942 [Acorus calamus]